MTQSQTGPVSGPAEMYAVIDLKGEGPWEQRDQSVKYLLLRLC
jgi:hypothetical protein